MTITLERNVELPTDRQATQRPIWNGLKDRLPFDRMRVGESFALWPHHYGTDKLRLQNYVSGAACAYRKERNAQWQDDWNFTTRQMPNGTVRCWRTN